MLTPEFLRGLEVVPPPNRHLGGVGEIYFRWDNMDRHHLAVDLSGPLAESVVEAGGGSVPLGEYLGRHPGRREEVRRQIRRRLLGMPESPPAAPG
jgi:hypothetical protein